MTSTTAQSPSVPPSPVPATVADVMQRSMTTVDQYDHVAAAAYLMKHAATSALMVIDTRTDQTVGISRRETLPTRSRTVKTSTRSGSMPQ